MSIVAALDKVLFFNASSKYSVLRMKTEDSSVPTEARSPYRYHDHLIRFTAVGIELPQTDTVKIKMDGEWKDGKYGLQLQVDHWQEIVPPTLEGVRNYLASGLLKGIGEKTADAIIEKFGVNALEILEHQPDRLLEIRGITKERLAEIKDAYAETSRMRVLMTLLAPFKVTPTTAQKIYQHFGPACADIVRQSPFNLCQVPGFGFKRIDAIVQKSGGDLRDPKRVHGALFYALEDARTKDGHLYLEAEALLKAAMQLLNERIPLPQMRVPMSQVEQELSAMIRQDEVVSNHGNVYLPKQFLQESETAQKAVELFLAKPTVVDIAQPLERVKNSLGLNLSKRQSEGVEMVFRHNLSIITGGPGTGKTTVLKTVIEVYRQLYPRQKIVLGAPTGKASRRMAEATGIDEAQTLHSILKLHGDSESKKDRERKPLEAGLLIVDETSMVDMWLIHQLFSRLRPGTKVLLVGDADQLESVGAGDVFHELIGSGVVPVTVLDEIFRQAQDSLIAHNARFINEGKTTLYYGEDFAFHKAESQEETAGIIRELYQEQIAAKGIEQVEILSPFRSEGEASVNSLNEAIREEINPTAPQTPEIVYAGKIFRLNDRVMQMRNNYDIKLYDRSGKQVGEGVFNGDIGTIRKISGTNVVIEFDGRYMDCPQVLLDDLELSYAITIHKSMGSEYDTVIIPLLAAHNVLLTRNLLYTAITRAKRRVLLVGEKRALYMAIHRSRKGKRNTMLGERIALYYKAVTRKALRNEEGEEWQRASYEHGYWCSKSGSYHTLIPGAAQAWGLSVEGCTASEPQRILDALADGKLVVALMTKGHFTKSGHFIVLRGVQDEKILVADPASYRRSQKAWDLSIILNEASRRAGAGGPFWIIG